MVSLIVFMGTYVLPVAISYLLYRLKYLPSLEMKNASERRIPYLIAALCYYLVAELVDKLSLPPEIYLYILAGTLIIIIHLILLLVFKPSAHLAGIGGFTGLLLALSLKFAINLLPLLGHCFLLSGFLASARLYLKAHDGKELAFGYLGSFALIFLMVYFA